MKIPLTYVYVVLLFLIIYCNNALANKDDVLFLNDYPALSNSKTLDYVIPAFPLSNNVKGIRLNIKNIPILILRGTYENMGIEYGKNMKRELKSSLKILKSYYVEKHKVPYEKLIVQADSFYNRFPQTYQLFIQGVSQGSGLKFDDVKILNAMETMPGVLTNNAELGGCSFISIAPEKTATNAALIGRNYDYLEPFNQIAKYLTITILAADNTIPTAIISMPGQIYCPTCINAKKMFMELNNGMPSGGSHVEEKSQSLLANMLQILQNSNSMTQIEESFETVASDYSLIINIADAKQTRSYEFSTDPNTEELCAFQPEYDIFVSTNFFLSDEWSNIKNKTPTDDNTWLGVTRRNNLLKLASEENLFNIDKFKKLMDKNIIEGGAVSDFTIYQLIYDPGMQNLYVKINNKSKDWVEIPLGEYFKRLSD
jgi:hypothetical protein